MTSPAPTTTASTTTPIPIYNDINEGYFGGAVASLAFDLTTVALFVLMPRARKHPASLFMWRVVCSLVIDIMYIVMYATQANATVAPNTVCQAVGFVNQFASFAGDMWWVSKLISKQHDHVLCIVVLQFLGFIFILRVTNVSIGLVNLCNFFSLP
jgi:hypothetical protein